MIISKAVLFFGPKQLDRLITHSKAGALDAIYLYRLLGVRLKVAISYIAVKTKRRGEKNVITRL
jgi:hypothetical protein